MRRGFLGGDGGGASERLRRLRRELEDAERELRRRRQERLQRQGSASVSKTAPLPGVDTGDVGGGASAGAGLPEFGEDVVEALVAYSDPPVAARRVAEAAAVLLKAPALVALGEEAAPGDLPWGNVQALLRRGWKTQASTADLVAALRRPIGARLRLRARAVLFGGEEAVAREALAALGPRCAEAFDFVAGVLERAEGPGEAHAAASGAEGEEGADGAQAAVEAVAQQEQEVARLRRKLREAERSEANAQRFAEERGGAAAPAEARPETKFSPPPREEVAGKAPTADDGANATEEEEEARRARLVEDRLAQARAQARASALQQPSVACARQLQYKLNDAAITPLSEAMLHALVGLMLEPYGGTARQLRIVGFAEAREEPEVAQLRADAVRVWLLERGVPEELLALEVVVDAPRGSRRTELHLLGEQGNTTAVREKAEELMRRVMPTDADVAAFAEAAAAARAAQAAVADGAVADGAAPEGGERRLEAGDEGQDTRGQAPEAPPGPVLESTEEFPSEGPGSERRLRLVFDLRGAPPADVALEVGTETVRLASASGAWQEVVVTLPFAAAPPPDGGAAQARFSKRRGTLAVSLVAA